MVGLCGTQVTGAPEERARPLGDVGHDVPLVAAVGLQRALVGHDEQVTHARGAGEHRGVLQDRRVAHQEHVDVDVVVGQHPGDLAGAHHLGERGGQRLVLRRHEAQRLQVHDADPQSRLASRPDLLHHRALRPAELAPVAGHDEVELARPGVEQGVGGPGPAQRLRDAARRLGVEVCRVLTGADGVVPGGVERLVELARGVPVAVRELLRGQRGGPAAQDGRGLLDVPHHRPVGGLQTTGELGVGALAGGVEEADAVHDREAPEEHGRGRGEAGQVAGPGEHEVGGDPHALRPGREQTGVGQQRPQADLKGLRVPPVVGVDDDDVVAAGQTQGGVAGAVGAAVDRLADHPDPGVQALHLGQQAGGLLVPGGVVHDEQLQVAPGLREHRADRREQRGAGPVAAHEDGHQTVPGDRVGGPGAQGVEVRRGTGPGWKEGGEPAAAEGGGEGRRPPLALSAARGRAGGAGRRPAPRR
nr:hypothetical protein [Serinicoccus chungangensis]